MRVTVAAFLMISCGVASLSLSGCGGASLVAPETGLQMRIQWPEVSRLLPDATQSVRVQVQDAGGFQTFRVANKPAGGGFSTLVFFGLKPGDLNVEARAFPAADAQGVALAQTNVKVTVSSGNQTNLQIALASSVDRVEVTPASASIRPGSAQTLSGVAKDAAGNLVPLTLAKTRWTSSDASVASVDSTGKVTAIKEGSTNITFTDTESGKSGTSLVIVSTTVTGTVDHVDVTPTANPMTVAQTKTLTATLRDASNGALPSGPGTWSSSDATVASVDSAGKVTALKVGSTTISFTHTASGKVGTASVTVSAATVNSVTLNPMSASLTVNQETTLQAILKDGSGTILPLEAGTWSSSQPTQVSVDANGKIKGLAITSSPVLITFTHTATGKSGSTSVTVSGEI
nr:Ig-like domain-containing protein [Armatimonas sp.]